MQRLLNPLCLQLLIHLLVDAGTRGSIPNDSKPHNLSETQHILYNRKYPSNPHPAIVFISFRNAKILGRINICSKGGIKGSSHKRGEAFLTKLDHQKATIEMLTKKKLLSCFEVCIIMLVMPNIVSKKCQLFGCW